jgi:hypothetical protein
MRLLEHEAPPEHPAGRGRALALALVVVLAVIGGGIWWWTRPAPPATGAEIAGEVPAAPTADAAPPRPRADAGRAPAPSPREGAGRRGPRPAARAPEEPAPAPAPAPELRVEADVTGASVFVDRKYLGTTPLVTREVAAGSHQLNVAAEGEESVVRTIDVAAEGPTTISVRLREVRLDTSVAVVHKHGMGSCEGRLTASPAGVRYITSNAKDGFTLSFESLEIFRVDYLEKHLQVKQKGGRTWNFTTTSESADPLFVFHRDVERARAKLAAR